MVSADTLRLTPVRVISVLFTLTKKRGGRLRLCQETPPPPPSAHHDCANLLMCDVQLKVVVVVVAGREGLGGWGGFKGGGGPSNTTIELKCTLVRSALSLPLCTITCLVLK